MAVFHKKSRQDYVVFDFVHMNVCFSSGLNSSGFVDLISLSLDG